MNSEPQTWLSCITNVTHVIFKLLRLQAQIYLLKNGFVICFLMKILTFRQWFSIHNIRLNTPCTLLPETCAIACACAGTHANKFTCAIYHMREVKVFSFFVLLLLYIYIYTFTVRENVSLKKFSLNIIYRKCKT